VDFRLEVVVVADPRGSTTTTEVKLRKEMPSVEDALETRAHERPAYRFSKDLLS